MPDRSRTYPSRLLRPLQDISTRQRGVGVGCLARWIGGVVGEIVALWAIGDDECAVAGGGEGRRRVDADSVDAGVRYGRSGNGFAMVGLGCTVRERSAGAEEAELEDC